MRMGDGIMLGGTRAQDMVSSVHVDTTQGALTPYVLADPACVHCEGLTCASQKVAPCVKATTQQGL